MPFLLSADDVALVKSRFAAEREALSRDWRSQTSERDPDRFLLKHAEALDRAVTDLIGLADLPQAHIAVAAVGGYGRRELFPFSDIDLLVLLDSPGDEALSERISAFLAALWELGLSVGASVRTREEFLAEAAKDVSVATTYLESRLLWGCAPLFFNAREDFYAELDARAFFRDKMFELARRHQRYEDTPYSLEPNLKESPGGLFLVRPRCRARRQRNANARIEPHHAARRGNDRELPQLPEDASHRAAPRCGAS